MMSELRRLSDTVYAFPGDNRRARPWLGAVTTAAGTVLIDSGNGPLHAAALQAALDRLGAPPVSHILLTHHHWDHVFGSAAFPGARVVAHVLTQRHLRVMAGEPWSADYVAAKEGPARGPSLGRLINEAVPDWTAFRAVPADIVFNERFDLTLGNVRFAVEHVGGQHEPDQCLVHVEPGNVLFLGDAVYGRGPRAAWDLVDLRQALAGFLDRGAAWYVEGHRPPADRETFRGRLARL